MPLVQGPPLRAVREAGAASAVRAGGCMTAPAMVRPVTDCYIGRHPTCGCIRFWVSDDCPDARRSVMKAMRDGLHIERAETERARGESWRCASCSPREASPQLDLLAAGASK